MLDTIERPRNKDSKRIESVQDLPCNVLQMNGLQSQGASMTYDSFESVEARGARPAILAISAGCGAPILSNLKPARRSMKGISPSFFLSTSVSDTPVHPADHHKTLMPPNSLDLPEIA